MLGDVIGFLQKYSPGHGRLVQLYDLSSQFYGELGEHERAYEAIGKAIEIWPDEFQLRARLGLLYASGGQLKRADETFEKLLDNHKKNPAAVATVARFFSFRKQPERSEALLREAIRRGVDSDEMQKALGKALLKQESPKKRAEGQEILKSLMDSSETSGLRLDSNGAMLSLA